MTKGTRYKCHDCGEPALFYSKRTKSLRGDSQHTLCRKCFEMAMQEGRKKALVALAEWEPPEQREDTK